MNNPSNYDVVIDSRDVIGRFTDMHDEIEAYLDPEDEQDWTDGDLTEVMHELKIIGQLCEDGEIFEDWEYGVTLVRDSYWEDYAQEYASDVYNYDVSTATGPAQFIDWEAWADDMQTDYTSIDFDGETYWTR